MLKGVPASKNAGKSFEDRLLDKVEKLDNGCWKWNGTMDKGVRPRFPYPVAGKVTSYNPRAILADIEGIELPYSHIMGCYNKECVNPHHVIEANKTKLQKLKSEHVREIKELRNTLLKDLVFIGYTNGEIAAAFNTNPAVIGRLLSRINKL